MTKVIVHGTVEPFQCWLRPAPHIDINLHCTFTQILKAVKLQQWYPPNCPYCKYQPKHQGDYESHVIKKHTANPAYPGSCPEDTARALYIVESIKRELEDRQKQKNAKRKKEQDKHG
jgi:hypothetical protein